MSSRGQTFIETSANQQEEKPEHVATYRQAVAAFMADGILEDWEHAELIRMRADLGISPATHQAIISELQCSTAEAVALQVDASAMTDYQVGAQCLIRFRVVNEGTRVLKQVKLTYSTSAQRGVHANETSILPPGQDALIAARFRPEVYGHHELQGVLSIATMVGDVTHYQLRPVHFRVGRENESSQNAVVNIDASSMRVGSFDNLQAGAGAGSTGRFLADGEWHQVPLRSCSAEEVERWEATALEQESEALPAASPAPPAASPASPQAGPAPAASPSPASQKRSLSIGREVDNGLVLESPQVSRHHAVVEYDGKLVVLTDRGSSNGTFVNGQRITGPTSIWPADLVGFGSYTMTGEALWQRVK